MEIIDNAINIRLLRSNLADVLYQVRYRHDRLLVVKYRQPLAAIVSVEDLRLLQAFERLEAVDGTENKSVLANALSYEARHAEDPALLEDVLQDMFLGGPLHDTYGQNRQRISRIIREGIADTDDEPRTWT